MKTFKMTSPTSTKEESPSNTNDAVSTAHAHAHRHLPISQLNQIFAGGISGACTRTLTQPFDVLKIRFQLQVEPVGGFMQSPKKARSKYTSIAQACRVIYSEEGARGFFKGHNAGQFMSIVYGIVQFWSYEQIKEAAFVMPFMERHHGVTNFVSGGLAGCIATFFSMPFDVIRTRLVAQDAGAGYKNTPHAIPIILREEGVRGFFRGLGTTLVQIGPMVGLNFMFYKQFNEVAKNMLEPKGGLLPTWILLVNGGAAGVASKAAVYPLDFVKKRLQMQGFESHRRTFGRNQTCNGAMHCIMLTVREEGFLGFYKGMNPTLIKSGLTTALYFSIYDKVKLLLNLHSYS